MASGSVICKHEEEATFVIPYGLCRALGCHPAEGTFPSPSKGHSAEDLPKASRSLICVRFFSDTASTCSCHALLEPAAS